MLFVAFFVAQQCQTPDQVLEGLLVPNDGASGVPVDVTPFVANTAATALDDLHISGPDGVALDADLQDLALGTGYAGASIKRVVPKSALTAGQTFTIRAGGEVLATFGTGSSTSTTPGAPDASLGSECAPSGVFGSGVSIGVKSGDAVLFIADVNGEPQIGGQVTLGAVVDAARGGPLELFGSGAATVNVAAVDFAGNVSASTPVKVTFPPSPLEACSSAGGMPFAWIVGAGLLARRSSRKRRVRLQK